MSNPVCPECGAGMILRETKRYRHKDGTPRKFLGCERYPECDGIHGAHPDGKPLGIPANKETKQWRIRAHAEFNKLFEKMSKTEAYKKLQEMMGLSEDEAHIAMFDIKQCKKLIELLDDEPI